MRRALHRYRLAIAEGLIALGVFVVVAILAFGSSSGHRGRGAVAPQRPASARAGGRSLLDALAPDLEQSTGGSVTTSATTPPNAPVQLSLPLTRAVAQLFLVGFAGTDAASPLLGRLRARDWAGVVLDVSNYVSPTQLTTLTALIRAAVKAAGHTPALVVARQAGGDASALPGLPPEPEPLQSAGGNPKVADRQALDSARELRSIGVSAVIAPDADLSYQGGPAAGHSFGSDPALVTRMVLAAVRGYREAGLIPILGPFPGEGAASSDPNTAVATVGLSAAQLRSRDEAPFAAAVSDAPAIQLSDALFAAIDPATPASLSPAAIALLRHGLRYRGVIVTGDLTAATAATGTSVGAAAVAALKAGADLLYISGDAAAQEQAYDDVLVALRHGQLSERSIAESAARVLALKRSYGLLG